MKRVKMREAFSMITAIFVLVLMASIGAFVLNLSGKTVKVTTAQYQEAQAELYAKSYTSFAIMAVTAHIRNSTNKCVETINATIGSPTTGNGYRIRTQIAYIGPSSVIGQCSDTRRLSTNVDTNDTPLTLIIDAYVDYKDPDNPSAPWLSVHRRTIQKI